MMRQRIFKGFDYSLLAGVCFIASTTVAFSNPVLNNVAHGDVTIQQTTTTTTVNQASQQAIINWKSFNINNGEHTHFQQPNGGVALNRISGNQGVTQIYGQLSATGKIILVNPAGIYFGPSAYVNVGGIIASTAGISDQSFLNNQYNFDQVSPYAGEIINKGTIIAAQNGMIALMGNGVTNEGYLEANMGKVVLASGETFIMSFSGNDMISFAVGGEANKGINNTGALIADGGSIMVHARVASNVIDDVINMQGIAQARSVYKSGGSIVISGGKNGTVKISGKLIASGKNKGEKGGSITVTGQRLLLSPLAILDVRGDVGGGSVYIGGNYQGKGPLPNASALSMEAGARIFADAIDNGNGGTVILWADEFTRVKGTITASAGVVGGDGGFVETSSHYYLDVDGAVVDTSSIFGKVGTWLLDPGDLSITAVNNNVTASSPFEPTGNSSTLNVATLTAALGSNNVTVQTNNDGFSGSGDITVDTDINWSSGFKLTLSAFRNIVLNSNIANTGGASVALYADNTGTSTGTVCGAGSALCGGAPAGSVSLSGGAGVVEVYYNPTVFGTPNTVYTGGTTPTAYMLVHELGLSTDTTTRSLASITNSSAMWDKNFALSKDIDASDTINWNAGAGWVPISTIGNRYRGKFDGNNHEISNLYINRIADYQALFTITSQLAVVKNLSVSGDITGDEILGGLTGLAEGTYDNVHSAVNVTGTNAVGGLFGILNVGAVSNSSATGNVIGDYRVGGFAGIINTITGYPITNSYSTGNVSGGNSASEIGGFTGYFYGTTLTNAYSTGTVTVGTNSTWIGGFAGTIQSGPTQTFISDVYSTGDVVVGSGSSEVGGFVGYNFATLISNAYSAGDVSAINGSYSIGGFVGDNRGAISLSFSTGDIVATGTDGVGGFVGWNNSSAGNIDRSYSTGNVTARAEVGGFVGTTGDVNTISNSYSTGNVSGTNYVGGFVGDSYNASNSIKNSYSIGIVTGTTTNVGGFAGFLGGATSNNFWDTDKSGMADGYGANTGALTNLKGGCLDGICSLQPSAKSSNPGAGVNLSEQATYPQGPGQWDFTTNWSIIENYSFPYIKAIYPTAPRILAGDTTVGANQEINLVIGGAVYDSRYTSADGSFYFLEGDNAVSDLDSPIADGTPLLIYAAGSGVSGNAVATAPVGNGSLSNAAGLDLTANTISVGPGFGSSVFSTSNFVTILGGLSGSDFLFSYAGSDITIGSSLTDIDFLVSAGTTYTLDGSIVSAATGTTDMLFDGPLVVTGTQTISLAGSGNNTLVFDGAISGGGSVSSIGAIGTNSITINSGSAQTWRVLNTDAGTVSGFTGYTGAFSFSSFSNLIGGSSNDNTFIFSNNKNITGNINGGSLTNTNTLDYDAYLTPISVELPVINTSGTTRNSSLASITEFTNINNLIGNFDLVNVLTSPYEPSAVVYTGIKQGYVDNPTIFYGFGPDPIVPLTANSDIVDVGNITEWIRNIENMATTTVSNMTTTSIEVFKPRFCTNLTIENHTIYIDCNRKEARKIHMDEQRVIHQLTVSARMRV